MDGVEEKRDKWGVGAVLVLMTPSASGTVTMLSNFSRAEVRGATGGGCAKAFIVGRMCLRRTLLGL